jgi:hypothetical protein
MSPVALKIHYVSAVARSSYQVGEHAFDYYRRVGFQGVVLGHSVGRVDTQRQRITVYVSGWLEYEVDNPAALADAAGFTPGELDPDGSTNLRSMPNAAYQQPPVALCLEVGKRLGRGLHGPAVPGATFIKGTMTKLTTVPPTQHGAA